ncbi:predicted protein [Coccidioides posadasii str. Silveira]|uniref:Predicted protein n=1 Tax=Coccidioides posadasii (strain RMSCC 757 / Silveira) TaxID=443226 RepID=E9DC02_COCPS|nr:predicted protein [Coccidioides posadasii str. Silveira]
MPPMSPPKLIRSAIRIWSKTGSRRLVPMGILFLAEEKRDPLHLINQRDPLPKLSHLREVDKGPGYLVCTE